MQLVVARGLLPPRPALTLLSGNMLRSCKRILGDTPVGAAKCCFHEASPECPRILLQSWGTRLWALQSVVSVKPARSVPGFFYSF
jgi:hypothetical protein